MMVDLSLRDEYFKQLADRYTAAELVEEMDLDVWDVIEGFQDELIDNPIDVDRYRHE